MTRSRWRVVVVMAVLVIALPVATTAAAGESASESRVREQLSGVERGTPTFAEGVELLNQIEAEAAGLKDRESQSRFAWYRLRAMMVVLTTVDAFGRATRAGAQPWIDAHRSELVYNDPAGAWILNPDAVLGTHDTYRGTAAADEIAWLFVQNGWPGECAGDVPCYVRWQNGLSAEYLRRQPRGRYANAANDEIARTLNGAMDNLEALPGLLGEFDARTGCGELHQALDPLVAAVKASTSSRKTGALAAATRFSRLCRNISRR